MKKTLSITEDGFLDAPQEEIEPPFLDSKLKRRVSFQVPRETGIQPEKRYKTMEGIEKRHQVNMDETLQLLQLRHRMQVNADERI